ncbi:hypothetical protein FB451DRAFT_1172113 [Mycena latifolia]|nr:hypothetical protein FB451DRAFT_1172113 [Mycena latifolia]
MSYGPGSRDSRLSTIVPELSSGYELGTSNLLRNERRGRILAGIHEPSGEKYRDQRRALRNTQEDAELVRLDRDWINALMRGYSDGLKFQSAPGKVAGWGDNAGCRRRGPRGER